MKTIIKKWKHLHPDFNLLMVAILVQSEITFGGLSFRHYAHWPHHYLKLYFFLGYFMAMTIAIWSFKNETTENKLWSTVCAVALCYLWFVY